MAVVIDERFEGTGYEESGWTENVPGGCTVDEDSSSSNAGSPAAWASQCLKIVKATNTTPYTYKQFGDAAVRYLRFEFYATAWSIADGAVDQIAALVNNAVSANACNVYLYRSGSTYYVLVVPTYDGTNQDFSFLTTINLNTRYRVEIKWDHTNDLFEAKVNGTSIGSRSITAGAIQAGSILLGITGAVAGTWTVYFDLVTVDDADWVGSSDPSAALTGTATASITEADIV